MAQKGKKSKTTTIETPLVKEEDFIELMKEVSVQPAVEIKSDEEDIIAEQNSNEEIAEDKEEIINKEDKKIEFEADLSDEYDSLKNEEGNIDLTKMSMDKFIEVAHEIIDKNSNIAEVLDEAKKASDDKIKNCNCKKEKPRMTYNQMMGYDWNGQNFSEV